MSLISKDYFSNRDYTITFFPNKDEDEFMWLMKNNTQIDYRKQIHVENTPHINNLEIKADVLCGETWEDFFNFLLERKTNILLTIHQVSVVKKSPPIAYTGLDDEDSDSWLPNLYTRNYIDFNLESWRCEIRHVNSNILNLYKLNFTKDKNVRTE